MRENYWKNIGTRRLSRRTVLGSSLAGATGIGALAMVGCGNDDEDSPGTTPGAATPTTAASDDNGNGEGTPTTGRHGGTFQPGLRFYTNDIPTLDPHATVTINTILRANGVYSRLMKTTPDRGFNATLQPDLATGFEQVDEVTYRVALDTRAMFHPPVARALTAEDVVFTFNRMLGIETGEPAPAAANFGVVDVVDSVEATDGDTVMFHLKRSETFFDSLVLGNAYTGGIQPIEMGDSIDPAERMVGTGPWMFDAFEPGSRLQLVRNPDWHHGPELPYFDEVVCNILPDPTAKLNAFLGGSLDTIDARGVDLGPISEAGGLGSIFPDAATNWSIQFNLGNSPADAPWQDHRVRQAISLGLDRDALNEAANQLSLASSAGYDVGPLWPSHLGASPLFPVDARGAVDDDIRAYFEYNPERARALLAEAGYEDGFEMMFERNIGTYGDQYDNVAESLAPMLNAIGVRLNVEVRDHSSHFGPMNQRGVFEESQLYASGGVWSVPLYDLQRAWTSDGPANLSSFTDPTADQMVADLAGADDEAIIAALPDIMRYHAEQMYTVPIYVRMNYYMYQGNLVGPGEYYTVSSDYSDLDKEVPLYWRDA